MDSQQIVDIFEAKLPGQQLLFSDPDYVLLRTKFKDQEDEDLNRDILVHWWMNVYSCDFDCDTEIYGSWSSSARRYFKYAHPSGCYLHGANQSVLDLCCYKNTPLEPQLKELELWVPHIVVHPYEDDRPSKFMSIFESTLSLSGTYDLRLYSDTEICLNFSYHDPRKFDSLREAVDYVRLHHWYKKSE